MLFFFCILFYSPKGGNTPAMTMITINVNQKGCNDVHYYFYINLHSFDFSQIRKVAVLSAP